MLGRNVASVGLAAIAFVFFFNDASAQEYLRHHASACQLLGSHSGTDHSCVYVNEGGVANNCTDRSISFICPVMATTYSDYIGDFVKVHALDNNPTYNVKAYLFAKSVSDWNWSWCGSEQQTSGTGNAELTTYLCADYLYSTDYYGLNITIPPKYNSTMSFVYGYRTQIYVAK